MQFTDFIDFCLGILGRLFNILMTNEIVQFLVPDTGDLYTKIDILIVKGDERKFEL
jgi:hypothetical protein